jgi:Spy/CpxP family protein refolding chaperone
MQKKCIVTVFIVASALLLSSVSMFAQAAAKPAQTVPGGTAGTPKASLDHDIQMLRQDVQSAKKQVVAANVNLTDAEATKFWPIYDQYAAEVAKVGDARVALIKEYAASYDAMTDAQATEFMKKSAAIDQQFTATRSKYVPIFEKVISAKKTALWYQIDRRLDLLINLQLAANIPVVDTSK